jgi:hypothetical protein
MTEWRMDAEESGWRERRSGGRGHTQPLSLSSESVGLEGASFGFFVTSRNRRVFDFEFLFKQIVQDEEESLLSRQPIVAPGLD